MIGGLVRALRPGAVGERGRGGGVGDAARGWSPDVAGDRHDPPTAFHYKLPSRHGGQRPGAHAGTTLGTGQGFAAHRRLFDHPDPRRLDLRASLRDVRQDWLVRIQRQRVAVPVHAVIDVSASMHFGVDRSKLAVVADFVEALGHSAFGAGDPVGLLAYDSVVREDLFMPARHSRGAGPAMAAALRDLAHGGAPRVPAAAVPDGFDGLAQCASRLAGRPGLVFVVSDFHGPLARLGEALELLAPATVVPMIAWDPAEVEPPEVRAVLSVHDAETGERRALWLRPAVRTAWREAVADRRAALQALFADRGLQPVALLDAAGRFDGERLTRHFLEQVA